MFSILYYFQINLEYMIHSEDETTTELDSDSDELTKKDESNDSKIAGMVILLTGSTLLIIIKEK